MLDYLPAARCAIVVFIFFFATMQISLVLHNETLREAFHAHAQFLKRHSLRFAWFLVICALHYWFLTLSDTTIRAAATERPLALIAWKLIYISLSAIVSGWLLASWVCLFRQCEIGRVNRETWIRY